MKKIITNLWFDKVAEEAANFYVSVFKDAKIGNISRFGETGHDQHGQPNGQVMTMELEIMGEGFLLLNGGPEFKANPSISFMVACDTADEVNGIWEKLSVGGKALMELSEYPFSKRYGWIEDKYGFSWQVMQMGDYAYTRKIIPTFMFTGENYGKAEEAMKYYAGIFKEGKVGDIMRYGAGEEPDKEGMVKHASFYLNNQEFGAMESAYEHGFTFNEAISMILSCDTQEEVDYYWDKLREGGNPEAEQCGWLKDKYGISWQVVPTILDEMMSHPEKGDTEKLMGALLAMKKLDIAALKRAYKGE